MTHSEEVRQHVSTAQQRREAARHVLDCGHRALAVTPGRCWDCHLANLRASGQGARADRLVVLKRQRDEGCIDYSRLVEGLVAAYEQRYKQRQEAVRAVDPTTDRSSGALRCYVPNTRA